MHVELLSTFPWVCVGRNLLSPTDIVALGGFGTIEPSDLLSKVEELGKEWIERKKKDIILHAVVRGYASMTTSVQTLWKIKGSRVLDYFFTAYPFGSYMVLSQRYVSPERLELPDAPKKVQRLAEKELRAYKELLRLGIPKEEARSVLGLGTPTHMLAQLPLDSVASLVKREYTPKEVIDKLKRMKSILLSSELAPLFAAALNAPSLGGPFPNIFEGRLKRFPQDFTVVWEYWSGETEVVDTYKQKLREIRHHPPESWDELVKNAVALSQIAFQNPLEYVVVVEAPVHLSLFNELKRHRTIVMAVEALGRAAMEDKEERWYVYPSIKGNKRAESLLWEIVDEFDAVKEEIDPKTLPYITPQALRVGVRLLLPVYQLLAPSFFYRNRACERAEVSMKQFVRTIPWKILEQTRYREYAGKLFRLLTGEIKGSRVPLPKCVIGACPERDYCLLIKGVREYSDQVHRKINAGRKGAYSKIF